MYHFEYFIYILNHIICWKNSCLQLKSDTINYYYYYYNSLLQNCKTLLMNRQYGYYGNVAVVRDTDQEDLVAEDRTDALQAL